MYEDRKLILFSDETIVTGGLAGTAWITRQPNEKLEDNCIVNSVWKGKFWVFRGNFSADTKGPRLFWGNFYGIMNAERK